MLKYKVTINQQNIAETGLEPGMEVTDMQECQVVNMHECEVLTCLSGSPGRSRTGVGGLQLDLQHI